MARSISFLVIAAAVAVAGESVREPRQPQQFITVHVKRIVDGDTLRFTLQGLELGVRIWGIDAPERGQEGFFEVN